MKIIAATAVPSRFRSTEALDLPVEFPIPLPPPFLVPLSHHCLCLFVMRPTRSPNGLGYSLCTPPTCSCLVQLPPVALCCSAECLHHDACTTALTLVLVILGAGFSSCAPRLAPGVLVIPSLGPFWHPLFLAFWLCRRCSFYLIPHTLHCWGRFSSGPAPPSCQPPGESRTSI